MDHFDDSYQELYVVALRAALRVLGDREAARDVAAETMARAYSRWARIRGYGVAWVTRVAVNLALDVVRRRQPPIPRPSPSDEPSLDRVFLAAELARLPRRQREALVLRFLLDLDERTTADLLGVTVGTLKTHVSRGLARIRHQLPPNFAMGGEL